MKSHQALLSSIFDSLFFFFVLPAAPGMRPPMGGHMPMMPGPPMMRPPARPMMVPTRPGMTRPDRKGDWGASLHQFYITCTSPGDHGAVTRGVF